jgi:glycopeptide antibiotics resistance protein
LAPINLNKVVIKIKYNNNFHPLFCNYKICGGNYMKNKGIVCRFLKVGLIIIAVGYFYALLKIVLFKYGFTSEVRSINLSPFTFLNMFSDGTAYDVALKNILGNIAIFIPLGIFCAYILHEKKGIAVVICFGVSLVFEIIQYVTGSGAADIDDIILNTVGGIIGVVLYSCILEKIDSKVKLPISIFVFLCVFGVGGRLALYMYAPNILPAEIEYVNKDVVQGIDIEAYDMDALVIGVEGNTLITSMDEGANYIPEGKKEQLASDGKYVIAENANLILEEREYQYSPNGNIQKTTVIYSKLTNDELREVLKNEQRRASIYFNEEGECQSIIVIKW